MAFRIETAARALVIAALAAAGASAAGFRMEAVHVHLRKGCTGTLVFDDTGLSYEEGARAKPRKHPHRWRWAYDEIQQLRLFPRSVEVLTYRDNRWKLGADREFAFRFAGGAEKAGPFLRARLDQRFVNALSGVAPAAGWELPAKQLIRTGGAEGVLRASPAGLAFETPKKGRARAWRFTDIDTLSTSGPFDLTVTTFERSRADYGNRKSFRFQLKKPLEEARYNELWRHVQQGKGLQFVSGYREKAEAEAKAKE